MTDADTAPATMVDYRDAALSEIARLEQLLTSAVPDKLDHPTPCPGWSVLDVARHVAVTPPLIGEAFDVSLPPRRTTTPRPLPEGADHGAVAQALRDGARYVTRALSDDSYAGTEFGFSVPGRISPLPAETALRLTLTELVLHRCDTEMALGLVPEISARYSAIALTTLRDWLFLLSRRGQRPHGPAGYVLTDERGSSWAFRYDAADGWTARDSQAPTVLHGPTDRLALALAGRVSTADGSLAASDPDAARLLKTYLPGP